jgi:excinuclease UvrABC nuclease subunit
MWSEMAQVRDILRHAIDFDPEADFEGFLRQAPAKWAVYLLADAENRPLQLLCVKNLRYSLKNRLSDAEPGEISKRVNLRQIARKVSWRPVDSAFEADVVYHDLARQIFPQTYRGMVGLRPAWFLHVNPEAKFPRYVKTHELGDKPGLFLGPLDDKHAAARLIELIEDSFDLCRYYNILTEAPRGRACAYKEMGKCPAPCDGSISMEQYRQLIDWSAKTLVDPEPFLREHKLRMTQASEELRFESAAKIKAFIKQVSEFGKGAFRCVRKLQDFAYVSLQAGPKMGLAKVFLILPGSVEELADLIGEPSRPAELMRLILWAAEHQSEVAPDAEQIGVVTHHLFSPKHAGGVFLPLADISEAGLMKAYKEIRRQKQPEEVEGEGVVKELQAM